MKKDYEVRFDSKRGVAHVCVCHVIEYIPTFTVQHQRLYIRGE